MNLESANALLQNDLIRRIPRQGRKHEIFGATLGIQRKRTLVDRRIRQTGIRTDWNHRTHKNRQRRIHRQIENRFFIDHNRIALRIHIGKFKIWHVERVIAENHRFRIGIDRHSKRNMRRRELRRSLHIDKSLDRIGGHRSRRMRKGIRCRTGRFSRRIILCTRIQKKRVVRRINQKACAFNRTLRIPGVHTVRNGPQIGNRRRINGIITASAFNRAFYSRKNHRSRKSNDTKNPYGYKIQEPTKHIRFSQSNARKVSFLL